MATVSVSKLLTRSDRRTRSLLVESAWAILRQVRRPEFLPLKAWAERLATRRGRRVAVVALARKLAGILYAMMRDATTFNADRWRQPQTSQGQP
jgi:hypothetical protein